MLLTGLIALLLATIVAATAIEQRGTTNCDVCIQLFNFCVENGHTPGQEGCKKTCAQHVCHLFRHEGNEVCFCSLVSLWRVLLTCDG
ncbi:hypothetical protein COCVIDRAFT_110282 [Bipolaris victoriae FI3]|uniref:Extracellular membrane protein CFEM domain-containing protein n=1 Tax=Bipolaris victoriae (strain FI3) TaxID=930091 RepID=W7E6Z9_BIPV3|nr:hypothetical protein COCVIDRAFT_110282 [Bipolaris victoriae FI3]